MKIKDIIAELERHETAIKKAGRKDSFNATWNGGFGQCLQLVRELAKKPPISLDSVTSSVIKAD